MAFDPKNPTTYIPSPSPSPAGPSPELNGKVPADAGYQINGNISGNGGSGATGPTGPAGATGATGATGPAPAGSGIVSVTGGVLDAAGPLTGDTTTTAGGLATTTKQVSGTGTGVFGAGTNANVIAQSTVLNSGANQNAPNGIVNDATTDGSTFVTIGTFSAFPINSFGDWNLSVCGFDVTTGSPQGNTYRADLLFQSSTTAGATTLTAGATSPQNIVTGGAPGNATVQAVISGSNMLIQVKGAAAAKNWNWTATIQGQFASL